MVVGGGRAVVWCEVQWVVVGGGRAVVRGHKAGSGGRAGGESGAGQVWRERRSPNARRRRRSH